MAAVLCKKNRNVKSQRWRGILPVSYSQLLAQANTRYEVEEKITTV